MKQRGPPTRQQEHHHHHPSETPHSRDSDAGFNTSYGGGLTTDKHYSIMKSINTYLNSQRFHLSLSSKTLPSAKHVSDILRFLLTKFDIHLTTNNNIKRNNNNNSSNLEDEVFMILKSLNCPYKITKSALRAPCVPHTFPQMLSVIHWLLQLATYVDHLYSNDNTSRLSFMKAPLMEYAISSYVPYMKGDDEAVERLDKDFLEKMEKAKSSLADNLKSLDEEVQRLESELQRLKSKPSEREVHEKRRKDLEADLVKFQGYICSLDDANSITGKALEEKEKELAAKVEELKCIQDENVELKKTVETQVIKSRDAERMKRELVALEREISETEASTSSWEEKSSHLDSTIRQKLKELEVLSVECNQALRRLKLGVDFQYALNVKGSTTAEVLGIDYKFTLKPCISKHADEIKISTAAKLDEYIVLQQQVKDLTTRIEAKKDRLTALLLHIEEREHEFEVIRNQIEEDSSRCASEAQRIRSAMETEIHNLDIMEREASETLKAAELKLKEETRKNEQDMQLCAYELFALIDSISRCKEYTEKKISSMKKGLLETAELMSNAYKCTVLPGLNSEI